jgi:uncharacterized protein with PIN domain
LEKTGLNGNLPRFLADVMLGRLARWLRIFGYDTAYLHRSEDDFLIYLVLEDQGRILLTRDVELATTPLLAGGKAFLVRSTRLAEQIEELRAGFSIVPRKPAMCAHCNRRLLPIEKEKIAGGVPEYILMNRKAFWRCPLCERVYWEGTHQEGMNRFLGYNIWGDR